MSNYPSVPEGKECLTATEHGQQSPKLVTAAWLVASSNGLNDTIPIPSKKLPLGAKAGLVK